MVARSDPSCPPPDRDRSVRIFVSSTFRDMQPEREMLVKQIFPQLRRLCDERGVGFAEVDLRWGITDEQSAEGQVLPICLAEIDRCRPFFIGLLGGRYGHVPEDISHELQAAYPWLAEERGKSVTELEFLHGVLNRLDMARRAFFYFRDPARDAADNEAGRRNQLDALKQRIRASGLPLRDGYASAEELGGMVQADLSRAIDEEFPAASQPTLLQRQSSEHEVFARSRRIAYIGREADLVKLDRHAGSDGPPLAVVGTSGIGKSALVANWVHRYRHAHPDVPVLVHFVGATADSTDWAAMLRRVLGELRERADIGIEIPREDDKYALRTAFATALHMAAARGRQVLVIDGLDQLEDRDGAPDLVWLPPVIPPNVRVIVSALPGRSLEQIVQRGWTTNTVAPLTAIERDEFIRTYLARYTKRLNDERCDRIAQCPQASNPLFLRAVLEELRVFGLHERLDERIAHYLSAGTIEELYGRILQRWEEDYEAGRHDLVGEAMALIWASRRGLSETEMLSLLSQNGPPMPRVTWSRLYLAAEGSLISRGGLIAFFHDYFRRAVENRYVRSAASALHLRLADFFQDSEMNSRQIEELPWQLAEAGAWKRLSRLLSNLPFFAAAWGADSIEVRRLWAQVEANSPHRMVEAYGAVLETPTEHLDYLSDVATLLQLSGYAEQAAILRRHEVSHYLKARDYGQLQLAIGNLGVICKNRGDLDQAARLYEAQIDVCRRIQDTSGLAQAIGNHAVVLDIRGESTRALELLREQERLYRESGNRIDLIACLGNQALILHGRGETDSATALLDEVERTCREQNRRDALGHTHFLKAGCLQDRGDVQGAMRLYEQACGICREIGETRVLQGCLGRLASLADQRRDTAAADRLLEEQEASARQTGDRRALQSALSGKAAILLGRGDLANAQSLYGESHVLACQLGDRLAEQGILAGLAAIAACERNSTTALRLLRAQERICRELGALPVLVSCLNSQVALHQESGDAANLSQTFGERERVLRQLGDRQRLADSLGEHGNSLLRAADWEPALPLFQEQEQLCRRLDHLPGLSTALAGQAIAHSALGRPDEAFRFHQERERICRELGDERGLSACLGDQALILSDRGEHDEALRLHREEEAICRRTGYMLGLARSLANQANLLAHEKQEISSALAAAEEAYRLATTHGSAAFADQQIKPILDEIRAMQK